MKLFWSSRSPFVFKVMVAATELGLVDRIELMPTVTKDRPAELLAANPLGQIPVLLRDSGEPLANSPVICAYLDALEGSGRLFPKDPEAYWRAMAWQSLGDGLMTDSLARNREIALSHDDTAKARLRAQLPEKVVRGLDRIERDLEDLIALPFGIGHISIGCALAYLDFRNAHLDWRVDHPLTAGWMALFCKRPSVANNSLRDAAA